MEMLQELAQAGMEMVRDLKYRARRGEELDPVRAYDRLNRAIRRTVALKMRLREGLRKAPHRPPAPAVSARERKPLSAAALAERARLREMLADSIREQCDLADRERLLDDLDTRMEASDLEDAPGEQPIGQVFQRICGELGIGADLRRFTDAEMGIDPAQAAEWAEIERLRAAECPQDAADAPVPAAAAGAPAGPLHVPVTRAEAGPKGRWAFPDPDEGPPPEGALRTPWRPPRPGE